MSLRRARFASWIVLACAAPLGAQTPITAPGLGYPVEPLDGRATALGSSGIGLLGGTFSLRNPAELTEHRVPGFAISLSGERASVEGVAAGDIGRNRFTVIRALVPFGDWAVSLAFGGALDQDANVRIQDTLFLPSGTFPFDETREADGGISRIDGSVARRIGPLSIGVSAQRLTGSLRESFTRRFNAPVDGGPPLNGAGARRTLNYGGWTFKGGLSLNVADRFLIGGAVGSGGELTAEADDAAGTTSTVDLPTTLEVGASARIGANVLVTGGGGWAGWSTAEEISGATTHDITWAGVGIELVGARLLGVGIPLRVGARQRQLPFSFGDEAIEERALTAGLGLVFRGGTASLDLGAEFGSRGDFEVDGLAESFQRLTLGFTLRQIGRADLTP